MYKRKFLSSKLTLDKFIDKEIEKRKKYLRTLKNEFVYIVEEVEISNYLCFNGISYKYIKDEKIFLVDCGNENLKLKIINDDKKNYDFICRDGIIYISVGNINNNSYKERLEQIFKLKGIIVDEVNKKEIYNVLKNSMIDNYFSEFINKYLIKYLDYYDLNGDFERTKLDCEQKDILKEIYSYYREYLESNNMVTEGDVSLLLENDINRCNYKYIIVNSDISLNLKSNVLKIINDYREVKLIGENIKLLYDYKKYLYDNKKYHN